MNKHQRNGFTFDDRTATRIEWIRAQLDLLNSKDQRDFDKPGVLYETAMQQYKYLRYSDQLLVYFPDPSKLMLFIETTLAKWSGAITPAQIRRARQIVSQFVRDGKVFTAGDTAKAVKVATQEHIPARLVTEIARNVVYKQRVRNRRQNAQSDASMSSQQQNDDQDQLQLTEAEKAYILKLRQMEGKADQQKDGSRALQNKIILPNLEIEPPKVASPVGKQFRAKQKPQTLQANGLTSDDEKLLAQMCIYLQQ